MHVQVRADVRARGTVLDVGGGHRQTYLEFVDLAAADRLVWVDIRPAPGLGVVGSVIRLPLGTASVDTVLCFNLLEHVFDHAAALREMHRVMKPGAVLYGWTPFSIGVHGDPSDSWRYTPDALEALLVRSGFFVDKVTGCGNAFLSAFDLLRPYIRVRLVGRALRITGLLLAYLAGRSAARLGRSGYRVPDPAACPNGVWFVARRSWR